MKQTPEERRQKARWARVLKVYGITKEQYDDFYTDNCRICLRDYTVRNPAVVDHDHVTGEIRGLICRYCNHRIVGRHRDFNLLSRLVDYLTPPFTGYIVPKKPKKKRKKKSVAKTSVIRKKKI